MSTAKSGVLSFPAEVTVIAGEAGVPPPPPFCDVGDSDGDGLRVGVGAV
jgi:hypothetical protein